MKNSNNVDIKKTGRKVVSFFTSKTSGIVKHETHECMTAVESIEFVKRQYPKAYNIDWKYI